jgi:hypothetical protein
MGLVFPAIETATAVLGFLATTSPQRTEAGRPHVRNVDHAVGGGLDSADAGVSEWLGGLFTFAGLF